MEVYIEYVILDNFIIDYLIICFSGLILGVKFKTLNKLVSTLFGVVSAVFLPLWTVDVGVLFTAKVLVGIIMVLLLKKYDSFRHWFSMLLMFFTFTFVFGGLCYGILSFLGIQTNGSSLLINGFEFPMSLFVLLSSVYIFLLVKLIQYVRYKNRNINLFYDVCFSLNNKTMLLRGYVDSGNKLYDDQCPVVLIPASVFLKIYKEFPYEKILTGKVDELPLENPHYIDLQMVNNETRLLVFDVDEMKLNNGNEKKVVKNVKLGLSMKKFSSEFDCLLHSEFI